MMTIEDQLRQAAQRSGKSILSLCKASGLGYQSAHGFIRGRASLSLKSAAALAAVLGLELVPIKPRKRT